MLSRHAKSLYWIGRYQERVDYLARMLEVKYFSAMDVSNDEYRKFVLRSILFLGTGNAQKGDVNETDTIFEVALNTNADTSIRTYMNLVRENTLGVRNLVSNELWQCVNKNYHFVNNASDDHIVQRGLYEFTTGVQNNVAVFHSKLEGTLLHDQVWAFIKLGIELERAYQIIRLLLNTLIDVKSLAAQEESSAMENLQWITTLNILEATDMSRKIFRSRLRRNNTCEFLITNMDFARSLAHSTDQVNDLIRRIKNVADSAQLDRSSVEYISARLSASVKFLDYKEYKDNLENYLNHTLSSLVVLNDAIHKDFFEN